MTPIEKEEYQDYLADQEAEARELNALNRRTPLQDLLEQKEKDFESQFTHEGSFGERKFSFFRVSDFSPDQSISPDDPIISELATFLRESLKEAYAAGAKNTLSSHWFATGKDGTIDITTSIDLNKQALLSQLIQEVEGMKNEHGFWDGYFLGTDDSPEVKRMNEVRRKTLSEVLSLLKAKLENK